MDHFPSVVIVTALCSPIVADRSHINREALVVSPIESLIAITIFLTTLLQTTSTIKLLPL